MCPLRSAPTLTVTLTLLVYSTASSHHITDSAVSSLAVSCVKPRRTGTASRSCGCVTGVRCASSQRGRVLPKQRLALAGVESCHRPTRPILFVTPGAHFNLVTQLPDFLFTPITHTISLYFISISSASSVLFPSPDISLNILCHQNNWNNIIVCRPLVFSCFEAASPEPRLSLAVA